MSAPIFRLGAANWTIVSNALSMVGAMVVTSGLGVAYWLLAAHLFSKQDVGFAGASIAAMTLLGNAGMLGLGTLLIGELPNHSQGRRHLIASALIVAGIAGSVLGACFAICAQVAFPSLQPLGGSALTVGLFALGVGLTSITAVLDQALIGLLRGSLQLGRNTLFATSKLFALLALGIWASGGQWLGIYVTWLFGNVLSVMVLVVLVRQKTGYTRAVRSEPRKNLLRQFATQALGHHWLNLGLQVPGFAMPVVVTIVRSSSENAYFYVASLISSLVFFGPMALATSLYAVSARSPAALARRLRFTLSLALVAGVVANVVLFVAADKLVGLFGAAYAEHAGWTLRLLGLGVFPIIVKDHYVTISRIRGQVTRTAMLATIGSVLELVSAAIGGAHSGSLAGFAIGWLAALYAEALFMAPAIYRVSMQGRSRATSPVELFEFVGADGASQVREA